MAGFPNRITRATLGPTYENAARIRNPKRNLDAAKLNLIAFQLAGVNLMSWRALARVTIAAGVLTFDRKWFSWDPDGALPNSEITIARSSAGVYTWQFGDNAYADMDGTQVDLDFLAAAAFPQSTLTTEVLAMHGSVDVTGFAGGFVCRSTDSNAAADPDSFIAAWF